MFLSLVRPERISSPMTRTAAVTICCNPSPSPVIWLISDISALLFPDSIFFGNETGLDFAAVRPATGMHALSQRKDAGGPRSPQFAPSNPAGPLHAPRPCCPLRRRKAAPLHQLSDRTA